jgi:hypothetical protein
MTPKTSDDSNDIRDIESPPASKMKRRKTIDMWRSIAVNEGVDIPTDVDDLAEGNSQASPRLNIGKSIMSPRKSVVQRSISKQFRTPKHVIYWKWFVFIFILAMTGMTGWLAYFFASKFEYNQFKDGNAATTGLLLRRIEIQLQNFIDTPVALASLYGLTFDANAWPNATLSAFEETSQYTINVSNVELIYFCPLVPAAKVAEWEQYAVENYFRLEGDQSIYSGASGDWAVADGIYKYGRAFNKVKDETSDVLAPVWQISPMFDSSISLPLSTVVMFNLYTYNITMKSFDKVIAGQPWALSNFILDTGSDINQHNLAPIYANNDESDDLVGFFSAYTSWKNMLVDMIQTDGGSFYLVMTMEDDVGTFLVYGDRAEFVGVGDHHDEEFDTLMRSKTFTVGKDGTVIIFEVYPSNDYLELFTTNLPVNSTIVVVTVMVFTMLVFIIYDAILTRHEEFLAETANTNSTVVKQLFPQFVREKLVERAKTQAQNETKQSKRPTLGARTGSYDMTAMEAVDKGILAKKFDQATVLFADIAGFTKWSAGRDAEDVFDLLETLFARFDFYARKRGVFKVETIGDWYET